MKWLLVLGFFLWMFVLRVGPAPVLRPALPGAQIGETRSITSAGLGTLDLDLLPANNNLDVVRHQGRVFLAFRSAPNHFASEKARLVVVSSLDERTWRLETELELGADLREPRLLALGDDLFVYFAVLGTSLLRFEPDQMMAMRRSGGGWSKPQPVYRRGFVPWRTKTLGGVPYMLTYGDGRHLYDGGGKPVEVHWLTTHDGWSWHPVVPGQPAVHRGGGCEADFVDLPDGGLVAVIRNEVGDGGRWGSKICRATAEARGDWRCGDDPRKFDSPMLFRDGSQVLLIARRHLSPDGAFDRGWRILPDRLQTLSYQLDYWRYPKRCSLWRVDVPSASDGGAGDVPNLSWEPSEGSHTLPRWSAPSKLGGSPRVVRWVADLPSRGDTCFPGFLALGEAQYAVYNYSSPLDGPDLPWLAGQLGPTAIYRSLLDLSGTRSVAQAPVPPHFRDQRRHR